MSNQPVNLLAGSPNDPNSNQGIQMQQVNNQQYLNQQQQLHQQSFDPNQQQNQLGYDPNQQQPGQPSPSAQTGKLEFGVSKESNVKEQQALIATSIEIVPPASNLVLQILMKFEQYYAIFYTFYLILIAVFKGTGGLRYPPGMWELELSVAIVFSVMQLGRLDFGFRANRNEHTFAMTTFTIFTAFSVLFYAYFSIMQTYVLVLDLMLGCFGCFFTILEVLIGICAIARFNKKNAI